MRFPSGSGMWFRAPQGTGSQNSPLGEIGNRQFRSIRFPVPVNQ